MREHPIAPAPARLIPQRGTGEEPKLPHRHLAEMRREQRNHLRHLPAQGIAPIQRRQPAALLDALPEVARDQDRIMRVRGLALALAQLVDDRLRHARAPGQLGRRQPRCLEALVQ